MPDRPGPCVHPDIGAYALGLLEAEERTAYERHLVTCAHCLRTLEGLAPLIELLGQVDAASLLADAERRRVHRVPAHPPGAVVELFPRQREPSHDRIRRPHLRAWEELDDRFRSHVPKREPENVERPARQVRGRPRSTGNSDLVRRLVLVAAAATVLLMVSLVTIAARSSVTDPATVARHAPEAAPPAAASTIAAPPPVSTPPATAPAPPARQPDPPPTTPPPARTREGTKAAPSGTRPDTIKADPGDGAEGERLTGRDPATGAAAQLRLSRTAAGLDVSVTVTGLDGPCECALRVVTTDGAVQTALRWRMAEGQDEFAGLGSTTVDRAAIDRFEVVDAAGAPLITVSSR
jgi:hypothetical protein